VQKLGLHAKSIHSIEQSYFAYIAVEKELYQQEHTARALNGEIVSELESDNSDSYSGATDILSTSGKELVRKKRAAIRRRAKRKQAKAVAERRFLSWKISKRTYNPEGMPRHW